MRDIGTTLSRRAFLGSVAALAASASGGLRRALAAEAGKPDSVFGGVQIGAITYSFRSMPGSAEDILKYVTTCGISSIELMARPAEQYAKAHAAGDDPLAGFKALRKLYNDAGVSIHKHHKRILSLHLKDRKMNDGPNMPFGQGETPVAEVLQYMKKNRLAFPADIELEYDVPKDSDAVKEVAKCVQFCQEALA